MRQPVLLDTGPLVALLNRREKLHKRARASLSRVSAPLLTAEPVLVEAMFLLRTVPGGSQAVLSLVRDGFLRIPLAISTEASALDALMTRFGSVPMSVADACLVRMVELMPEASVFTFNSDFTIYRARRNRAIQLIEY